MIPEVENPTIDPWDWYVCFYRSMKFPIKKTNHSCYGKYTVLVPWIRHGKDSDVFSLGCDPWDHHQPSTNTNETHMTYMTLLLGNSIHNSIPRAAVLCRVQSMTKSCLNVAVGLGYQATWCFFSTALTRQNLGPRD